MDIVADRNVARFRTLLETEEKATKRANIGAAASRRVGEGRAWLRPDVQE
jgi:hypothetical protein